jgi:hypothetical protein
MLARTRIVLVLLASLAGFLAAPLLLTPGSVRQRVAAEYQSTVSLFGDARAQAMGQRAQVVYRWLLESSVVSPWLHKAVADTADGRARPQPVLAQVEPEDRLRRYAQGLAAQLYGAVLRAGLMLEWLAGLGLFLFAAVIDAVMQARIRHANGSALQRRARLAPVLKTLGTLCLLVLAYLLFPLAATVWFALIWTLLAAACLVWLSGPEPALGVEASF